MLRVLASIYNEATGHDARKCHCFGETRGRRARKPHADRGITHRAHGQTESIGLEDGAFPDSVFSAIQSRPHALNRPPQLKLGVRDGLMIKVERLNRKCASFAELEQQTRLACPTTGHRT